MPCWPRSMIRAVRIIIIISRRTSSRRNSGRPRKIIRRSLITPRPTDWQFPHGIPTGCCWKWTPRRPTWNTPSMSICVPTIIPRKTGRFLCAGRGTDGAGQPAGFGHPGFEQLYRVAASAGRIFQHGEPRRPKLGSEDRSLKLHGQADFRAAYVPGTTLTGAGQKVALPFEIRTGYLPS